MWPGAGYPQAGPHSQRWVQGMGWRCDASCKTWDGRFLITQDIRDGWAFKAVKVWRNGFAEMGSMVRVPATWLPASWTSSAVWVQDMGEEMYISSPSPQARGAAVRFDSAIAHASPCHAACTFLSASECRL